MNADTKSTTDLKTLTDVEVVTQWLAAIKVQNPGNTVALELLAEAERRGHKRMAKAFEALRK